jgi:hypothetical protein
MVEKKTSAKFSSGRRRSIFFSDMFCSYLRLTYVGAVMVHRRGWFGRDALRACVFSLLGRIGAAVASRWRLGGCASDVADECAFLAGLVWGASFDLGERQDSVYRTLRLLAAHGPLPTDCWARYGGHYTVFLSCVNWCNYREYDLSAQRRAGKGVARGCGCCDIEKQELDRIQ